MKCVWFDDGANYLLYDGYLQSLMHRWNKRQWAVHFAARGFVRVFVETCNGIISLTDRRTRLEALDDMLIA
jgi:hypothetical protein